MGSRIDSTIKATTTPITMMIAGSSRDKAVEVTTQIPFRDSRPHARASGRADRPSPDAADRRAEAESPKRRMAPERLPPVRSISEISSEGANFRLWMVELSASALEQRQAAGDHRRQGASIRRREDPDQPAHQRSRSSKCVEFHRRLSSINARLVTSPRRR